MVETSLAPTRKDAFQRWTVSVCFGAENLPIEMPTGSQNLGQASREDFVHVPRQRRACDLADIQIEVFGAADATQAKAAGCSRP